MRIQKKNPPSSPPSSRRWNYKKEDYFDKFDISFYESLCARKYYHEPWYGKEVKGGWPGVRGPVFYGWPVVNRFGEVIVIIKSPSGQPISKFLGFPHLKG